MNQGDLFGLPRAAAHAAEIDRLIFWSLFLVVALLILWGTIFALGLWRASWSKGGSSSASGKLPFVAEAGLVTAELVLLLGLALPLSRAQLADAAASAEDLEVRVVARQYAWNIHYSGPDGVFGQTLPERIDELTNPLGLDPSDPFGADDVATLNHLRLPAGRRVALHLTSRDVIHGFALPHFRVQRDAIPGLVARVNFVPDVSTEAMRQRLGDDTFAYEIVCAQLCGLGHSSMRGKVEVMAPADFDSWLLAQQPQDEIEDFWR